MEKYCIIRKKNTANKSSTVRRTRQNRLMLVSNRTICGKKKSWFIKSHETDKLEIH